MKLGVFLLFSIAVCGSSGGSVPPSPELLSAVANSGETLHKIIEKFVGVVINPVIQALDDRIHRINLDTEGMKEEDKTVCRAAIEDMSNARKEFSIIRVTLEALASDARSSANRLKRLINNIVPNEDPERIKKIVGRTANLLSGLINRSVGFLSEAKGKLKIISGRISSVDAHLTYLNDRLTSLLDRESEEHDAWVKKQRIIAYGVCAATIVLGPAVAVCYTTAAAILETKIAALSNALEVRKRAVDNAMENVGPLIRQLESFDQDVATEIEAVLLWDAKIDSMKDDFKDTDSIMDMIDFEVKETAIEILQGLMDTCQKYLDLKKT